MQADLQTFATQMEASPASQALKEAIFNQMFKRITDGMEALQ